ncbi:7TM GPCR, serpentine receptor class e (Sre) family-containing protein [Strongyloides ratti]|uniref:7TM GPCR, serpentine receptor class e (Sre) family-containing protein n=1 Tax=Strongyloides ratti TaxID=34506 RepID=A0A090LR02_STRRB|nr:7TM GPCR, serpentine receptor class e (Sre) family-containing protein [Strongyloides ratti]CEF70606.1 7TM GPCR, serpentine receptor class e (Sre) family-containing protein [Strongyloides ratti]
MKSKISSRELNLSEKYQIQENIKLFKWFSSSIITFTLINICYILYLFISENILSFKNDFTSLHNCLLFISYFIIEIFILIKRHKNKKKAVQICEGDVCVRIPKNNPNKIVQERLKKAKSSGGANIKIITQENKTLNMNYDQQSYFNILKQSW